ncbi:MAG: hypothetical protein ABEK17_02445 [Candidatus Aenigmatarchaeota archaeon]
MPEVKFYKTKLMKELEEKLDESLFSYVKKERDQNNRDHKDIGKELGVEGNTVKRWISNFYEKPGKHKNAKRYDWGSELSIIDKELRKIIEKYDHLPIKPEVRKENNALSLQIKRKHSSLSNVYNELGYLDEADELLTSLPKNIRNNFENLEKDYKLKFKQLLLAFPDFAFGNEKITPKISRTTYGEAKDLLYESNTQILCTEAGKKFLDLYNSKNSEDIKYKFDVKYTLYNFLENFKVKDKRFDSYRGGTYQIFRKRLSKKFDFWKDGFYDHVSKTIEENIKKIENDEKICEDVANEFINFYNEIDPETGLEYKFSPKKYNLSSFLKYYNPEENRIQEDLGPYVKLKRRLREKDEGWKKIFLDKLGPKQRRMVEYIDSGKKLTQEAARTFIDLPNKKNPDTDKEFKFTEYGLSKFLTHFDIEQNKFVSIEDRGNFSFLKARFVNDEEFDSWREAFYDKLTPNLEEKVKEILSNKRILVDSVEDYINFREKKETTFGNFLLGFNFDGGNVDISTRDSVGDYHFVLSKMKTEASKKNTHWKNIILQKLEDKPHLKDKLLTLDQSFRIVEFGYDPLESPANFENFIEDEEDIEEIIKFFGGNEIDVADILAVKYPGLGSRDEFLDMLSNDVLSDYLSPVNGNFDSLMDLVETGSRVLPFEENGFVRDMVIRKAKKYLMDDLGPFPDEDEIDEKIERLGSVIDEEDFYE